MGAQTAVAQLLLTGQSLLLAGSENGERPAGQDEGDNPTELVNQQGSVQVCSSYGCGSRPAITEQQ